VRSTLTAVLPRWLVAACVAVSVAAVGIVTGSTAATASVATGDTRTVVRPRLPGVCQRLPAQLSASDRTFDAAAEETPPDTARIQAALTACAGTGQAVELAADADADAASDDNADADGAEGTDRAFLSGPLSIGSSVTLVIDAGVTLYASRNPASYQNAGKESQCGTITAAGDGCVPFITIASHSAHNGIMGTGGHGDGRGLLGKIDGRGDLTMIGATQSWWELARAAEPTGLKQNNPRLMQANSGTDFTLYNVELANAAQFHVRYTGDGLTVWGVRINAAATARNTDGIDPSGTNATIRDSWIQAGDDGIAIKAGSSPATNMTIENNHLYGTHGISIGSETNGGVSNILVRHNTVDGVDGHGNLSTFNNGIRIKSDPTRGGLVQQVTYLDTCMTRVQAPLAFTPFYATSEGTLIPQFTDITVNGAVALHSTADAESQLYGFDADHRAPRRHERDGTVRQRGRVQQQPRPVRHRRHRHRRPGAGRPPALPLPAVPPSVTRRPQGSLVEQAGPVGGQDGAGAVMGAELGVDRLDVPGRGVRRHAEMVRDRPRGAALGQLPQNLPLPAGQGLLQPPLPRSYGGLGEQQPAQHRLQRAGHTVAVVRRLDRARGRAAPSGGLDGRPPHPAPRRIRRHVLQARHDLVGQSLSVAPR
jgi:polygalacturonase